jgi:peptidoglycan/LPS O-acetylase OafA/YrhL
MTARSWRVAVLCAALWSAAAVAVPLDLVFQAAPEPAPGAAAADVAARFGAASLTGKAPTDFLGLGGRCSQAALPLLSGDMLGYVLGAAGDYGRYNDCKVAKAQYCAVRVKYHCQMTAAYGGAAVPDFVTEGLLLCGVPASVPGYGMCVPSQCPQQDLNAQLKKMSVDSVWALPFQATYGAGGRCLGNKKAAKYHEQCAPNASFAYMEAHCAPDFPTYASSWKAQRMMIAVGLLAALAAACTAVGRVHAVLLHVKRAAERASAAAAEEAQAAADRERADVLTQIINEHPEIVDTGFVRPRASPSGSTLAHAADEKKALEAERQRTAVPAALLVFTDCFDLHRNLADFFAPAPRNSARTHTDFFEGIRTIAMMFVVYGHTIFVPLISYGGLYQARELIAFDFLADYSSIGLFPSELAVDVFFYLSGFLFAHLYLNGTDKAQAKRQAALEKAEKAAALLAGGNEEPLYLSHDDPLTPPACDDGGGGGAPRAARALPLFPVETALLYLHRYLRIVPTVLFATFSAMYILPLVPRGPLQTTMAPNIIPACETDNGWWRVALFDTKWDGCMGWFWYLTCDMRLFLCAPLLIATRFVWRGALFYALLAAGVAVSVYGGARYQPFMDANHYSITYWRMGPYLLGIAFASLLRHDAVRRPLHDGRVRAGLYAASVVLLVSCINCMWLMQQRKTKQKPSAGFDRFVGGYVEVAWGVGWGLVTLCWGAGHGGWLPRVLSHPAFLVLSKLTFCCYVIHPLVIWTYWASQHQLPTFSEITTYSNFAGHMVWAFIAALVLHVTVEVPFAKLNNLLVKLLKR